MAAGSAAGQNPNNAHPGSDYYVQPTTGTIQRQSNPVAAGLLTAAGFQGPFTWEQAQGILALGEKVSQKYGPGAPTATGGTVDQTGADVGGTAAALANPLAALGSLEAFYHVITDGKLWRSLGWVLLGVLLMLFGLALWLRIPQRAAGIAGAAARAAI